MGIQVDGRELETDEEGFLIEPAQWNPTVANHLAALEALELDESRWEIVNFIRDYFDRRHSVPELRVLLKELGKRHGKSVATRKYVYTLFPYGYGQQACKIAGMRKPRKLMLDV